ncbi:MAG: hypothetical protein ACI4LX_10800 [Treponema sp.]
MTFDEYETEREKLVKAKKGYDTNRTLCVAVLIFLIYTTFKGKEFLTMPWYILLILGVLAAATIWIFVHDCLLIKDVSKKLKALEEKKDSDTVSENKE